LRAFEAAARHLSFKKAAQELNVTPAAISQQVKVLEDYFSVSLFKRLTRALLLTGAGQMILPILSDGFDKLAEADSVLRNRKSDKILTVSVPPGFGANWLLPRLDHFRSITPEYEIRIDATEMLVDFNRENVDVALRYGTGEYPGLVSECLITEHIIPISSPKLLKGKHPLNKPDDLRFHTLLHNSWVNETMSPTGWPAWLKATGVKDIHSIPGIYFNNNSLLLQAAVDGQGVALEDAQIANEEIKKGRLVQLFCGEYERVSNFCYYLVYPQQHLEYPKVKAFRDWIFKEIKNEIPVLKSQ